MAAKLEPIFDKNGKRKDSGIYRRGSRYVIAWEHRGKAHRESFRTLAEAREAKGRRSSGEKRPVSRIGFEEYFTGWIESYAGRTARGFSETTRPEYRRPIEAHALKRWGNFRLAEIEPKDVRELFGEMRNAGESTSAIKKLRAALSALFATAVDDVPLPSNPVQGVRIPAPLSEEPAEEKAKALTRADLAILLAAIPEDWRLFFEFLAHTGVRISEAVGQRWEHLDLGENPKVRVREQVYKGQRKGLKSGAARRDIPLSPGLTAQLLAYRRDNYGGPKRRCSARRQGPSYYPPTSTGGCWRQRQSASASRSRSSSWTRTEIRSKTRTVGTRCGASQPSPSTPSAIPAPQCSSRPAATSSRCRSGWGITNRASPSIPTFT